MKRTASEAGLVESSQTEAGATKKSRADNPAIASPVPQQLQQEEEVGVGEENLMNPQLLWLWCVNIINDGADMRLILDIGPLSPPQRKILLEYVAKNPQVSTVMRITHRPAVVEATTQTRLELVEKWFTCLKFARLDNLPRLLFDVRSVIPDSFREALSRYVMDRAAHMLKIATIEIPDDGLDDTLPSNVFKLSSSQMYTLAGIENEPLPPPPPMAIPQAVPAPVLPPPPTGDTAAPTATATTAEQGVNPQPLKKSAVAVRVLNVREQDHPLAITTTRRIKPRTKETMVCPRCERSFVPAPSHTGKYCKPCKRLNTKDNQSKRRRHHDSEEELVDEEEENDHHDDISSLQTKDIVDASYHE